ncbi:MAG TPA: family 20 glycosylhydrolase, partial [Flavisolibacter sp.]|nr:family 20 glycosylhydrolase [Flavisolibacter sp.]
MRILLLVTTILLLTATGNTQDISIIPQPVQVEKGNGFFKLDKKTELLAKDPDDIRAAGIFNNYLQEYYHFNLPLNKKAKRNYIRLSTRKFIKAPDKDGYNLKIDKDGVDIEGDTYSGTFYGIQSLIQLLPLTNERSLIIPFVQITDYPRFNYRGMHLDVGRHFMPVSFVKKYIDYIALHKMNYLHWHLTEDQGWRIAINQYPALTETGAVRNGTIIGHSPGTGNDNIRYGGYYTQEEIKDVVKYAADRHISVIPEIEMPGHASAAIAAYPWLSCFPTENTFFKGPGSEKG